LTLSLTESLTGWQEPRILAVPPSHGTLGREAIDLAASAGLLLDPWQQLAVEIIFSLGPTSTREQIMWAAFEIAVLVARQNGKGGIIEAVELASLFLLLERLILHSAHEFKTSREGYLRLKELIEGAPHLSRKVKQFRQSNEDTSVELTSGARLRFMARSRQSGRGFSAQRLIVDEAQILSAAAMGALIPTLSAQPNPQINYFGTVPRPEDDAEHFTLIRDRGRTGSDPFLAWLEWNIGEHCDDLDDLDALLAANPAIGHRLSIEFSAKERLSLTGENYSRERLSIWSEGSSQTVIDLDHWAALADPNPPKTKERGIALDVTPDRSSGSVAFAGRRPDGRTHVELIANDPGTGWIVPLVTDLRHQYPDVPVMLDASGPAGSLIEDLKKAGIDDEHGLILVSASGMAQACGAFYDAAVGTPETVTDDGEIRRAIHPTLTHFDQPPLNLAIKAARKRKLTDAWAWARRDATDISPLVACTLALAALERAPKKKRSGKVW
jgi:hypothetical protein